jgi:hypothetical protein
MTVRTRLSDRPGRLALGAIAVLLVTAWSGYASQLARSDPTAARILVSLDEQGQGAPPASFPYEQRLTVLATGQAAMCSSGGDPPRAERWRFRLAAATVKDVRAAIEAAGFRTLKPFYLCAAIEDLDSTTISSGGRTVSLSRGAQGPPRLQRLIRLLEAIITSHHRAPPQGFGRQC